MSNAVLNAFIALIEEKPEAIEEHNDLHLQASQWSEDIEELADLVTQYCQSRPVLYETLKSLLGREQDRLPGKGTSAPPIQPTDYKYTILNTMHRVFETPPPPPKPES